MLFLGVRPWNRDESNFLIQNSGLQQGIARKRRKKKKKEKMGRAQLHCQHVDAQPRGSQLEHAHYKTSGLPVNLPKTSFWFPSYECNIFPVDCCFHIVAIPSYEVILVRRFLGVNRTILRR